MKIEVGKKYKGKINGVIFEVKSYDEKNETFLIITASGLKLHHSKIFLEHIIIEELA